LFVDCCDFAKKRLSLNFIFLKKLSKLCLFREISSKVLSVFLLSSYTGNNK
jgi:hypothetical protein